MIHARKALMGSVRGLFETEIGGIYPWTAVTLHDPEKSPEYGPDGKRWRLGKYRERVVIGFGDFRLEVESTEEKPPLGSVSLFTGNDLLVVGTLDATTWARIGSVVREKHDGR